MALQGTLDTFALPDVLRLLASTKKTGRLVIIGARGNGSVWVDDGSVVGTDASGATHDADAVEILFELLRFGGEGSFTFEAGTKADRPTPARAVEPLLIDAERQLAEWREIEAVVPSMDAWVSLVSDVAADEVTIAADCWKRIVAIGSGSTVGGVARTLDLGELDVCRSMKELVELGLVEVGTAPAGGRHVAEAGAATAPTPGSGASWDPFAIEIPGVDPATPAADLTRRSSDADDSVDEVVEEIQPPVLSVVMDATDDADGEHDDEIAAPERSDDDDAAEADEVARQLASLSPKAARAVAAAAKASTSDEREAALAEAAEDDDEPINRGLLLKFLSSVKS